MKKHTPGPWKLKVDGYNAHSIKGPDGKSVASCTQHRLEVGANGNLVAAAPELLEALKFIEAQGGFEDPAQMIDRIQTIARAAIAKAEGRE
jgi:hypothetical protein